MLVLIPNDETMHKFFRIIILYIALASPAILWAQESFTNRYNTIYITMNEGLPNNFVDDIYKDRQGFLWISMSGGGLSRYDGYEFVNFTPATPHCRLKSNFIRKVYEDNFQRLWVVSEGGTDIIDLTTMQSVLPHDPQKKLETLIKQPAFMVTQDANGCIWLYCSNSLHRIAFRTNGDIESIHSLEIPNPYRYDIIFKDVENEGKVWIGINGALYKIGITAQSKLEATLIDDCLSFAPDLYFTDFIAKENEVWIATDKGLYRYNKNEGIVKQYMHIPDNPHSLSQNFLTCLAITNDKQLLVASLKGINIYNPIKDNFERISDQASNTGSKLLNSNFINCIIVEGQHIWVGTESGGINKMTAKRLSIQNYQHDNKNLQTISHNPVNAVYEDNSGNLWVGTVEGGLNKKAIGSDSFIHYTYESGTLTHNSVSAITADGQGRLWIGTWGGGINLINPQNPQHRIEAITARNKDNYPIDFIGALAYDSINNGMWIGANQGLFFYDLAHKQLCSPFAKRAAEDIRGCIGSIIDKDGQLWMGCLDGVYIIDLHSRSVSLPEGTFRYRHLKYKLDDPSSGLIEKICCFYETQDGTLWLGSNGYGIYKRMQNEDGKEQFVCYNSLHGLPDNSIRSILEDDKGCIWIATNNGLSRFQPTENHFINYNRQDGLADTQFYWNAAHRSQYSKLYLGTVSGLVAIDCNLPALTTQSSKVRFTHLKVGNEEIFPGNEYLPLDIAVSKAIRIHEREKSFSLEFSALNYESDNTATYSYRLLGFDNRWIHVPASRRFATYTNLSPGNYTLQVKYTPYTPTEEDNITELQITIQPYFYKTTWFILLVIILATFATWQFYQWRIRSLKEQKARLHQKVEQRTHELKKQKQLLEEQTEELSRQNRMLKQQNEKITRQKAQLTKMTRKIQELTLDKIAFFTNITHEFRTPITLIIGPIERALKLSYNPQVIEQLHFVERNSKYLLSLVNQLMDFRKVESGKLEIVKSRNNFLKFANELIIPFEVFAKERDITVKRYFRMPSPEISYDEEAMHKVLTNLLSNAIKFSNENSEVLVKMEEQGDTVVVSVKDSGCGIDEEGQKKLLHTDTHFSTFGTNNEEGSGLGLLLCQDFAVKSGGKLWFTSKKGEGSTFYFSIPLKK